MLNDQDLYQDHCKLCFCPTPRSWPAGNVLSCPPPVWRGPGHFQHLPWDWRDAGWDHPPTSELTQRLPVLPEPIPSPVPHGRRLPSAFRVLKASSGYLGLFLLPEVRAKGLQDLQQAGSFPGLGVRHEAEKRALEFPGTGTGIRSPLGGISAVRHHLGWALGIRAAAASPGPALRPFIWSLGRNKLL